MSTAEPQFRKDLPGKYRPCIWCRAQDFDLVFQGPDRLNRIPGEFCLVQCKNCRTYLQNPLMPWSDLKTYYPEDYISYRFTHPCRPLSDKKWTAWLFRLNGKIKSFGNLKRRRLIERFQPGGRLLEVGCGTGAFLRELKRFSRWDLYAVEPNEAAARYTRNTLEIPVHVGKFEDVSHHEESLDAVVMWCVLEHLEDPLADIRRASFFLKRKGILAFTVPNPEAWDARLFGRFWSGWDLPRHLHIFPRKVIRDILVKNGFQILTEKCIAGSYSQLRHNLDFWSQSWEQSMPWLSKTFKRTYDSLFSRLLLFPFLWMMDRFKLATNVTFIARKK